MRDELSRRAAISVIAGAVTTIVASAAGTTTPGSRPATTVITSDLQRFRDAHVSVRRGASPKAAMEKYLAGASPGLRAYMATYHATAEDLAARLSSHPRFYAQVAEIGADVARYEPEIVRAAGKLHALAPRTPSIPMYFFVGVMGHGATVKEVTPTGGEHGLGVLIPIELLAISSTTDMSEFPEGRRGRGTLADLSQMTTHELAHVAQVQLQGLERYRSLYRDKTRGTHLAYAIREGGADFLAYLATGRLRARHRYLLAREREMWLEFSTLLYEPAIASRGWFNNWNDLHPDRPAQMGYAIGWSICKTFYEQAADKEKALEQILSAVEAADFELLSARYRGKMSSEYTDTPLPRMDFR